MGAIGFVGNNYRAGLSSQETKKLIISELKKNGIKATAREDHYRSFSFSLYFKPEEIMVEDLYDLHHINHYHLYHYESMLTPTAFTKLMLAVRIIDSFNYDNSNSMVDYYDCNFYYRLGIIKK